MYFLLLLLLLLNIFTQTDGQKQVRPEGFQLLCKGLSYNEPNLNIINITEDCSISESIILTSKEPLIINGSLNSKHLYAVDSFLVIQGENDVSIYNLIFVATYLRVTSGGALLIKNCEFSNGEMNFSFPGTYPYWLLIPSKNAEHINFKVGNRFGIIIFYQLMSGYYTPEYLPLMFKVNDVLRLLFPTNIYLQAEAAINITNIKVKNIGPNPNFIKLKLNLLNLDMMHDTFIAQNYSQNQSVITILSKDKIFLKNIDIVGSACYYSTGYLIHPSRFLALYSRTVDIKGLAFRDGLILRSIFLHIVNAGIHKLQNIDVTGCKFQHGQLLVVLLEIDRQFMFHELQLDPELEIKGVNISANFIDPGSPLVEIFSYQLNKNIPWIIVQQYNKFWIQNMTIEANDFTMCDHLIVFSIESVGNCQFSEINIDKNTISPLMMIFFQVKTSTFLEFSNVTLGDKNERDVKRIRNEMLNLSQQVAAILKTLPEDLNFDYSLAILELDKRLMPWQLINAFNQMQVRISYCVFMQQMLLNMITFYNSEYCLDLQLFNISMGQKNNNLFPCKDSQFTGYFLQMDGPLTKFMLTNCTFQGLNLFNTPLIKIGVLGLSTQLFQNGRINITNVIIKDINIIANELQAIATIFYIQLDPFIDASMTYVLFQNIVMYSLPSFNGTSFCKMVEGELPTLSYDSVTLASPLAIILAHNISMIFEQITVKDIISKQNYGGFYLIGVSFTFINCEFSSINQKIIKDDTNYTGLGGMIYSKSLQLQITSCTFADIIFSHGGILIADQGHITLTDIIVNNLYFVENGLRRINGGAFIFNFVENVEATRLTFVDVGQGITSGIFHFSEYLLTKFSLMYVSIRMTHSIESSHPGSSYFISQTASMKMTKQSTQGVLNIQGMSFKAKGQQLSRIFQLDNFKVKFDDVVVSNIRLHQELYTQINQNHDGYALFSNFQISNVKSLSKSNGSIILIKHINNITFVDFSISNMSANTEGYHLLTFQNDFHCWIRFENFLASKLESLQVIRSTGHNEMLLIKCAFIGIRTSNLAMVLWIHLGIQLKLQDCIFRDLINPNDTQYFIGFTLNVSNTPLEITNTKFLSIKAGILFFRLFATNLSNPLNYSVTFTDCHSVNPLNVILFPRIIYSNYNYIDRHGFYPNNIKLDYQYGQLSQTLMIDLMDSSSKIMLQPGNQVQLHISFYYGSQKYHFEVYHAMQGIYDVTNVFNYSKGNDFIYSHSPFDFQLSQGLCKEYLLKIPNYRDIQETNFSIEFCANNCSIGYVLQKGGTVCVKCDGQSYSYDREACYPCQISTECSDGLIVALQDGYWRLTNVSTSIVPCSQKVQNCLKKKEPLAGGLGFQCAPGKMGPLCQTCDFYGEIDGKQHFRLDQLHCEECDKLSANLTKYLFLGSISLVFLFLSLHLTRDGIRQSIQCSYLKSMGILIIGITGQVFMTGSYIKVIINHFQILSVLKSFKYKSADQLSWVVDSAQVIGSGITQTTFSLDCLALEWFQNKYNVQEGILIIQSLIPVGLFVVQSIALTIKRIILRERIPIHQFWFCAFFIYYFIFPTLSENMISFSSCLKIGEYYYLKSNLLQTCYGDQHKQFFFQIVLPLGLLYMLCVPFYLFYRLFTKSKKLMKISTMMSMGNIYLDYRLKVYFFEMFKFIQKTLVTIIPNAFDQNHIYLSQSLIILLITMQQITQRLKPYGFKQLTILDQRSSLVLSFSIMITFLSEYTSFYIFEIIYFVQVTLMNLLLLVLVFKQLSSILFLQYEDQLYNLYKRLKLTKKPYSRAYYVRKYWKQIYLVVYPRKTTTSNSGEILPQILDSGPQNVVSPAVDQVLQALASENQESTYSNETSALPLRIDFTHRLLELKQTYQYDPYGEIDECEY